MKKLATLLAGLLLVGGTIFAADVDAVSSWTYNGNVEFKAMGYDSNTVNGVTMFPAGGQWLKLEIGKQVTETVKATLKYDTDDADPDMVGLLLANYQPNEFVEAQVAVDVNTTTGLCLAENAGGDVYIKLKPSDMLSISLKPFDAGIGLGDEFETMDTFNKPGMEVTVKLSDSLTLSGVINGALQNVDGDNENKLGIKAKGAFTADSLSATAEFSMNTQDDENLTAAATPVKMAADVRGSFTAGTLTLSGEFLMVALNKAGASDDLAAAPDESGTGIFAKAALGLGEIASMDTTVYASYTMTSEYLYYDGDYSMHKIAPLAADTNGGVSVIKAGMDNKWNEVTINNELAMIVTGEDCYVDSDNKATDSSMTFTTKVSIEF